MTQLARVILAVACLAAAIPVEAQTSKSKPAPAAAVDADKSGSPFDAPVVDAGVLGTVTGKADLSTVISAKNTSNVSNNSVSGNSVTGSIAFDPSSFSGLNGLSLLSANTGNNVSINSSLNVNVAIRP